MKASGASIFIFVDGNQQGCAPAAGNFELDVREAPIEASGSPCDPDGFANVGIEDNVRKVLACLFALE